MYVHNTTASLLYHYVISECKIPKIRTLRMWKHFEFNDSMNVSTQGRIITISEENLFSNTDTIKCAVSRGSII